MRAFFLLLYVQLLGLANSLFPMRPGVSIKQRRLRMIGTAIGVLILAALLMAYIGIMSFSLAEAGFAHILPSIAVLMAALQGVVFSFLKANGTLFGFRDYDLIMSLPVPRRAVVASRMVSLLCFAEVLALTTTPMFAVYFAFVPATPAALLMALASMILAPLAPTAVAVFLSYGITMLASRFRHANLAYIILALVGMLAFTAALMVFSFQAGGSESEVLMQMAHDYGSAIETTVTAVYPPAVWAAQGIAGTNFLGFAGFLALSILIPALSIEIMQRSYLQLNGAIAAQGRSAHNGREVIARGAGRTRSPFWAIVVKEWRTLIGIPSYAFNCLFGFIFLIATAVLISFIGIGDLYALAAAGDVNGDVEMGVLLLDCLRLAIPWGIAFCAITCYSSVVSFSLEGRNSWLLATSPVSTRTIVQAKFASNAIPFAVSLAIAIVILLVGGAVDVLGALETLLVAGGAFLLWIGLGIHIDIKRPNLTWMSPQDVVKRGTPIFVCALGGTIYCFALGALIVLGAMNLGVNLAHIANLVIGIVSAAGGIAFLEHAIRKTPVLFR